MHHLQLSSQQIKSKLDANKEGNVGATYVKPLSKFSKKYIKTRAKKYPGNKTPKRSFYTDEQVNKALAQAYRTQNVAQAAKDNDIPASTLYTWVKAGYTDASQIPRTGCPKIGIIEEAALIGYIAQSASLSNGKNDIAFKGKSAAF